MEKRLIPFCMAALLAVGACGGGAKKDAEGFPPAKTLVADSIAIEEVLQPSLGGIYGDYAVLVSRMTSPSSNSKESRGMDSPLPSALM